MDENLREVKYQLFSMKFTPFKGVDKNSRDIIIKVIT